MLITNITLYPIDQPVIEKGFLAERGGKIIALGTMDALPAEDFGEVLDLSGCTLLPGLVDAHCHLGLVGDSVGFENDDSNEMTDPVAPQLRAVDAVNPFDRYFRQARQAGVTTIVTGPGSANPIAGQMVCMKTGGVSLTDMILREPCAMKFAFGENPKRVYHDREEAPMTRMAVAALIREQLNKASEYAEKMRRAGIDGAELPDYDAKCEALLPLLEGKISAQFHAHRAVDMLTAMRLAEEFHIKYALVHGTEAVLIADEIKKAGAAVITGPILTDRSKPELVEADEKNPGLLAERGIQVAICTDHPETPIQHLLLCAAVAVRGGMKRETALRAITLTPASIAGVSGRVGSLTVGKDADLLVLPGDPFDVTARPKMVFINGKAVEQ